MKIRNNDFFVGIITGLLLSIAVFWQFLLKGLYLFPGNFLLAWYEPWKTESFKNGIILIAHKPIADDVFRQLYPFKVLAAEMVQNNMLPLWNPYNGSGMPLLATMHAGLLNPLNILFLFLPGNLAWTLHLFPQIFLIALFTYIYCRKIGIGQRGSLISTLVYTLSGFTMVRIIYAEYIFALPFLPLFLYIIESAFTQKSKKIFFLPFVIFLLITSGHPQPIFYVLIFSFAYMLFRFNSFKYSLTKPFTLLLQLFLLWGVGLGLASIQLVPTLELMSFGNISSKSSEFIFDRSLVPLQHFITVFIPNYFGNQATYNYWGASDYIESVIAIGLLPCFFIIFLFTKGLHKKNKLSIFYVGTAILTLIATLDWSGTRLFYSLPIPIIATGVPTRIFFLTTFSLAILSGYGYDAWFDSSHSIKVKIKTCLVFTLLLTIFFIFTFLQYKLNVSCNNTTITQCRLIALRNTLLEYGVFAVFCISFLLYERSKKFPLRGMLYFFFTVLLLLILGIHNSNRFLPFSKNDTFLPKNNLLEAITTNTKDARVFGFGDANIKTDFATYFRFYDPNYYDPLYIKRYGELISYSNTGEVLSVIPRSDVEIDNSIILNKDSNSRRERLLSLLNVGYFIYKKQDLPNGFKDSIVWQDDNWYIAKNKISLPRAYFVANIETIKNEKKILERLFSPEFPHRDTAILQKDISLPIVHGEDNKDTSIEWKIYNGNEIKIITNSKKNRFLVLADNYYPGWKGYIDEKETEIFRTNYSLRGIIVPAGKHTVGFIYQPNSLVVGATLSFGSLLTYVGIIVWKRSPNKQS